MGRERKIGLDRSVEEVVEGRPDGARAAPHARYAQPIASAFATGEVAALGVVRRYSSRHLTEHCLDYYLLTGEAPISGLPPASAPVHALRTVPLASPANSGRQRRSR